METTQPVDLKLPRIEDESDRLALNLAHKVSAIVEAFPDRMPNVRELEEMTRVFGIEMVSMALVQILSSIRPNRYFLERVDRALRDLIAAQRNLSAQKAAGQAEAESRSVFSASTPLEERAELCVIESVDPLSPGAKWGSHVETWRSWGRKTGLTTDVIQTRKQNSLLANAELIRSELRNQPHDRRIIATLGQGGAEFRLLVEQLLKTAPHELAGIQMWINVSGLARGATGATAQTRSWLDRQSRKLSLFLRGWPVSMIRQLSHLNPRLRAEPDFQGLPFVCVSLVGFPTLADIPVGLKGTHLKLTELGPNDGLKMFHESVLRPGYVVPVPGMSHKAEPEKLGPWFQAVLTAFLNDQTSSSDHVVHDV
ncbi:MAG: hypothetical protein RBT63_02190 [Bdellovibrionales bacterium]|jgi:hypothetical protein|nr:hypothetical protein [Bdellovibrionales bacterium]